MISSSSSDDVNNFPLNQSSSRRGRPQRTQSKTNNDASPLLSINEHNVGPVLEKLLAMMQSMSMLLSALKTDLRYSNMPEVVAKKRNAATTQLWRAFVAYRKSFAEIEEFACSSITCGQTAKKLLDVPVHLPPMSRVNRDVAVKSSEGDVIELSESETEDDVERKRPRYDEAETIEPLVPMSESNTSVELTNEPSLAASSSDSSRAPSAVTSNVSLDESNDTTASCVCVDPPSDVSEQSHVNTAEHVLPQPLNAEPDDNC